VCVLYSSDVHGPLNIFDRSGIQYQHIAGRTVTYARCQDFGPDQLLFFPASGTFFPESGCCQKSDTSQDDGSVLSDESPHNFVFGAKIPLNFIFSLHKRVQ
jgi:hypothetical protein